MLVAKSLCLDYGNVAAVSDVSFEVLSGEIVGLLGHNGAGKTSIMRMLTGFLRPSSGSIIVDNTDIWENLEKSQKRVGYLPESEVLYGDMTVYDYLYYLGKLNGIQNSQLESKVKEAILRTGLEDRANWYIEKLSKGFQQRAGVAQAIINDPKILVLDEPTNGLDPSQVEAMRSMIKTLSNNDTAVILSTHVLQEVEAICDRAIIIGKGKKLLDAPLASLQPGNKLIVTTKKSICSSDSSWNEYAMVDRINLVDTRTHSFTYSFTAKVGKKAEDIAPFVANKICELGLGLLELSPEKRDLQNVFREFT